MPFKSEAQRRFLWVKHPEIAKRWTAEGKEGNVEGKHMMPEHHDSKEMKKMRKKKMKSSGKNYSMDAVKMAQKGMM